MSIQSMEHVGIVVDDLAAATKFFTELGLASIGEGTVEGEWVERVVGLDDLKVEIAMLKCPDGHGGIELVRFLSPAGAETDRQALPNVPGMRHLAFVVDDIDATVAAAGALGAEPVGAVETYEDTYRLCYIRGPEGIIVELIEQLG